MPSTDDQSITVQARSVAALLTDEMRARVAAATFRTIGSKRIAATVNGSGRCVCPLGVAVGITRFSQPSPTEILARLGVRDYDPGSRRDPDRELRHMVVNLIYAFDGGEVAPEDVKPLLGVVQ